MDFEATVGVGGALVAIPILTHHVKLFFAAMPWTAGAWSEEVPAAPWPLVSDALGVAWAAALWHGGLLAAVAPGVELTGPVVALFGISLGIGASAIVDGKRALRAPAS